MSRVPLRIALLLLLVMADTGAAEPFWSINLHAQDVGHDLARAQQAFHLIRQLGATGVRTDLSWPDLEPRPGVWDAGRETWYRQYVAAARAQGLEVIAILHGGSSLEPFWAHKLARSNPRKFLSAFENYARRAAGAVANQVRHFQVWNEANAPVDVVGASLDAELLGLGAVTVKAVRPDAIVSVNVLTDLGSPRWAQILEQWLGRIGPSIDVVALDAYPGTWSGGDGSRFEAIEAAARVLGRLDPARRLALAIGETGYSTWGRNLPPGIPFAHREANQVSFFARALPALRRQLADVTLHTGIRAAYVNLYELADGQSSAGPNPELHFGILHTDFSEKPAAAVVRTLLAR